MKKAGLPPSGSVPRPPGRTRGSKIMALNPRREHKGSGTKCNGFGVLRAILETAREKAECGLSDLTVLSAQVDPYRLDTPSGHRDGKWLAEQLDRAIGKKRKIHWRGLHYALVSTSNLVKPNGDTYRNDDDNWQWLINVAGKAARWLGYIPFERITGNRNAEPFIHHKARVKPQALVRIGIEVTVPDASDLEPTPDAEGFEGRQPYCFAIFGEKASLEDVLLPIARAKHADLYLPTGEISDTLIFKIAEDAAAAAIDAQVDPEILAGLRTEAAERLAELASVIADINERLRLAADSFRLPPLEVPQAEIDEETERYALVSFEDNWVKATRALIARKRYGNGHD